MFDPYHKWLGISPKDQPPNHYRLLGIELFETDPDVIDAAANRQMAYIQGCATGPHLALSQQLLNEIAAARLCLLNPKKKADYDAHLKGKLDAASVGVTVELVAQPPPSTTAVASDSEAVTAIPPNRLLLKLTQQVAGAEDEESTAHAFRRTRGARTRSRRPWKWPVVVGGVVLGVVVLVILAASLTMLSPSRVDRRQGKTPGEKVEQRKDKSHLQPANDPRAGEGKWQPLFNGKDLDAWEGDVTDWKIKDGLLVSPPHEAKLLSRRADFQDFRFRVEAKISNGGIGGQGIRCQMSSSGNINFGYYVQTNSTGPGEDRTGSLFIVGNGRVCPVPIRERLVDPETWFTQEIIARGNAIAVVINNKRILNYEDVNNTYDKGKVLLHSGGGQLVYRKVEVLRLPKSGS